jgi:hypothetical protein
LAGHYISGTATAPLLLAVGLYLISRVASEGRSAPPIQP